MQHANLTIAAALTHSDRSGIFLVAVVRLGHAQIVVAAQIDIVIRRIIILVDIGIVLGQVGNRFP